MTERSPGARDTRPTVQGQVLALDGQCIGQRIGTGPVGHEPGSKLDHEVHVAGLFPGEVAEVAIESRSRHHARSFARVTQRLRDHDQRRNPPCPRHEEASPALAAAIHAAPGRCSGCSLMALGAAAQREAKRSMLAYHFGLAVDSIEHVQDTEFGYRWSAKRVAFTRAGLLRLGSHRKNSHHLADMHGCLVDHPAIEAAFEQVCARAQALGIRAYNERTGQGELRHVWAKTDGTRVCLLLVTATPDDTHARRLADAVDLADTVAWSVQSGTGNAMRGCVATTLRGPGTLKVEIAGVTVEVTAQGFLQPNPGVAALAYQALICDQHGQRLSGQLALDLYAGAGVTTALLRQNFAQVFACDAHAESAGRHGVQIRSTLDFLATPETGTRHVDLVIANPPRSGLGPEVCARLRELPAARLHIMSCSPASLARDLAALTDDTQPRAWTVCQVRAFDTLPQTPHVELVLQLVRPSA